MLEGEEQRRAMNVEEREGQSEPSCTKKEKGKQMYTMLSHHRVSPYAQVLNIYTCEPNGGVLGWIAAFPDEIPEDDVDHGLFLLHSTLPGEELRRR